MCAVRDYETVRLFPFSCFWTIFPDCLFGLFFLAIVQTLKEEQRKNVLFIRTGIDVVSQKDCGPPEIGFQFILCNFLTH